MEDLRAQSDPALRAFKNFIEELRLRAAKLGISGVCFGLFFSFVLRALGGS